MLGLPVCVLHVEAWRGFECVGRQHFHKHLLSKLGLVHQRCPAVLSLVLDRAILPSLEVGIPTPLWLFLLVVDAWNRSLKDGWQRDPRWPRLSPSSRLPCVLFRSLYVAAVPRPGTEEKGTRVRDSWDGGPRGERDKDEEGNTTS